MESVYRRTGDIDTTVKHLVDITFEQRPDYFLRREILAGVCGQMVKHIAKAIENGKSWYLFDSGEDKLFAINTKFKGILGDIHL